jgi:hypothetical protein
MFVRTDGLNTIGSYAEAVAKWKTTKPIRGRDDNVRPLGPRKKHGHMNIRMVGDKVALRLYHTDIIVWHPDDSFEVEGYTSISTDQVFNAVGPPGVYSQFACPQYNVLWLGKHYRWTVGDDGKGYALREGKAHIIHNEKGGWMIDPETPPDKFEQSYIERSVAKAQLAATNYHEFQLWASAKDKLIDNWGDLDRASCWGTYRWLELLADRKQWDTLVLSWRSTLTRFYYLGQVPAHVLLSSLFLHLRRLIYTPAVWSSREIDYVTSWHQLANICHSGRI